MKNIVTGCVTVITSMLLLAGVVRADDCPGPWRVLPNYHPSQGAPCQILGLNSRMGVCLPGYAYETLCDDASNGRYKTCQGPRSCVAQVQPAPPPPRPVPPPRPADCTGWDYDHNRPCPPGYINRDCRGDCGPR